jgi:predicted DsbA family dithiol-disulfide isomerase
LTGVSTGGFDCDQCEAQPDCHDSSVRRRVTTVHPHAQTAAEAAEAAGSQRVFWQMHSTLLAAEAPFTHGVLAAAAAAAGLNVPSFQEDLRRHIHLPRVREDSVTRATAQPIQARA